MYHVSKVIFPQFTRNLFTKAIFKHIAAPLSMSAEENTYKEEFVKNNLEKCEDLTLLLNTAAKQPKISSAFKTFAILAEWHKNGKINFIDDVQNHPQFKMVSDVIPKYSIAVTGDILKAIEDLLSMGMKSDNVLIETLENDVLWSVRNARTHELLQVLMLHMDMQETQKQREVLKATIFEIEKRLQEFSSGAHCYALYKASNQFSKDFLQRLDDHTLAVCEAFNTDSSLSIIMTLSKLGRRPTPLLRALAYNISKKDSLNTQQICNIFFSLSILSFYEEALLYKLSSSLITQIDSITQPFIAVSILRSMSSIGWKDTSILDALSLWFENNMDICEPSDYLVYLVSIANIYFIPSNFDKLAPRMLDKISLTQIKHGSTLIDLVWALAVLDKATKEQIAFVLNQDVEDISQQLSYGKLLKLLNINAVANSLLQSHDGQMLKSKSSVYKPLEQMHFTENVEFSSYVNKVLQHFIPSNGYIRENILAPMGFKVTAEIIFNSKAEPLPMEKYSNNFGEQTANKKSSAPLPKDVHRVVIMAYKFRDYNIATKELKGSGVLAHRILRAMGYKVVEIPYWSVDVRSNGVKDALFIQNKIKEAVQIRRD